VSWWMMLPGGEPTGPVSTELILRGISAGTVPRDVLVCRVGDREWRALAGIRRFADAFFARRERRRFSVSAELTRWDRPPSERPSVASSFREEPTAVEPKSLRRSEPPPSEARIDDEPFL
jgi:hypothetical protein